VTAIPESLRQQVIARAQRRCEYCYAPLFATLGMEVDHIIPTSKGGFTELDNLCLSCDYCNGHKLAAIQGIDPVSGEHIPLFNPRIHQWAEHLSWVDGGQRIVGLTATGRATVERLKMNLEEVLEARMYWIEARWYPPHQEESN
jgi:hypothetical protein